MSRIFLSHSSGNNAEAIALRDWLADNGWKDEIFLDLDPDRGIAAGQRWERALHEAANRCEAVLFLVSKAWLSSGWCLKEFHLAHSLNKRLFGVLIENLPLEKLPEELAGTWQIVRLAAGRDHIVLRGVLPITHEEAHVTFSREGLQRLKHGLEEAGLGAKYFAWPPLSDPHRPPYRGLRPLEAEDAGIFFGRDAPIVEALDKLRGLREGAAPRLLTILGASGAGKSSFLRAGLLPRLERDDRNFLPLPVIRPERASISGEAGLLRAIEAALAAHGLAQSRASLREAIAGGAEKLRLLFSRLVETVFAAMLTDKGGAKRPVIVLAIDQAEELFIGDGAKEGQALLELVRDLVKEDRPAILALFTIRSDSYDRMETAKALEGVRQQTMPLLPMPRGAYQTVIEGPAGRFNEMNRRLTIEPGLTQRLLEDIEKGGGSDALPLLAFTLEQLYLDYGGSGALRLVDYEAFGGVRGAIEAAVERGLVAADNDLRIPRDPEARLALLRRGMIPWLAGIDPDTGSPRRRVARRADIPGEATPLIDILVEQRLLVTDRATVNGGDRGEITIEPAHEALLRQWGQLHRWLEEDVVALTTLEAVKRATRDWAANGRKEDWLNHAGTRLEDAEKIVARADLARDLSADACEYLRECRAREQTVQRERLARLEREREEQQRQLRDAKALADANRRTARRTGIGLVAALIFLALAGWQWQLARTQTQLAKRSAADAEQGRKEVSAARSIAESRLDLLRKNTEDQVTLILSDLRSVQGIRIETIARLLERVRETVDQLSSVVGDDPTFQQYLAKVMSEFGETYLKAKGLDQASAVYNESLQIYRSLASKDPNTVAWQRGIADQIEHIGLVQQQLGRIDAAMDNFKQSLDLRRAIVDREPANAISYRDLAWSDYNIGEILMLRRTASQSLASDNEALANMQRALSIDPENLDLKYKLSLIHVSIGVAHEALGHPEKRLESYQTALEIRKQLVEAKPDNAEWKRVLSYAYFWIGNYYLDERHLDEALKNIKECMALRLQLVQGNPGDLVAKYDLAWAYHDLGIALQEKGDLTNARINLTEAFRLRTTLVELDDKNTRWRKDLALSYESLGDLARAQKDATSAITQYNSAITILEELIKAAPTNAGWSDSLAIIYNKLGSIQKCRGDMEAALASYEQALTIRSNLLDENSNDLGTMLRVARSETFVAEVLQLRGETDQAHAHYQHAAELAKRMLDLEPNDKDVLALLAEVEKKMDMPVAGDSGALRACTL
jgi:tetratricopeptide (TPR) repeat protein